MSRKWLPQGTTFLMDEVGYEYPPRANNNRAIKKLERSPKQNHNKTPVKQSYDKVEVRLLKRSADKGMNVNIMPVLYKTHLSP